MTDSVKYGLGSVVFGVLSYFWETAGFGIFLGILGALYAYISYNEAQNTQESTGLAFTGAVISIIALIYNFSFL